MREDVDGCVDHGVDVVAVLEVVCYGDPVVDVVAAAADAATTITINIQTVRRGAENARARR